MDNGLDAIVTVDAGDDTFFSIIISLFLCLLIKCSDWMWERHVTYRDRTRTKKELFFECISSLHIQLESITNLNHNYFNKL